MAAVTEKLSVEFEAPKNITDEAVIGYIWGVVRKMRAKGQEDSIDCILCEEKLIHLSLVALGTPEPPCLAFSLAQEATGFVQKVNRLAMQNIADQEEGGNVKFISKAVDVVMQPDLGRHFTEQGQLARLTVLTFNNFSCILKQHKHLLLSLKAMSHALALEEGLLKERPLQHHYDIVPSYLNKAAILSEMGKHDKALEEIRKARAHAERIGREVDARLAEEGGKEEGDKEGLRAFEEKRHYGLYMRMLIYYNMGVEKEHQKLLASAAKYYQEGKRLALLIDNQLMAKKLETIILHLARH